MKTCLRSLNLDSIRRALTTRPKSARPACKRCSFTPSIGKPFAPRLLALLLFLTLPAAAFAQFNYTADNGQITITGYTGPGGDVTIPATIDGLPVTRIEDRTFGECTSMTRLTIPSSVTSLFAFGGLTIGSPGCTNLIAITVDALNSVYSSVDGVLFDKRQTTLIQYPGGKAGSYTIPNSVTHIGDAAFAACTSLASVSIPNSVTNIGEWAFFAERQKGIPINNCRTRTRRKASFTCR